MNPIFEPKQSFKLTDFPSAEKPFPIMEVFGYEKTLSSAKARESFSNRLCPFSENKCEKYKQYGYGYCSVQYRASDDNSYEIYAVCDHRLDGGPLDIVTNDYFDGHSNSILRVPEVVFNNPRISFDYVLYDTNSNQVCGVETQAIDIRGGGVGPAFQSILDGKPADWRKYFSQEALHKGRKDNVAYGVNTANIYKRLGLQIAEKAALLKSWNSKLYVVVQDRTFNYMKNRINLEWNESEDWDISFFTFDYTGEIDAGGQYVMAHKNTYRIKVSEYASALVTPTSSISLNDFLAKVLQKSRL